MSDEAMAKQYFEDEIARSSEEIRRAAEDLGVSGNRRANCLLIGTMVGQSILMLMRSFGIDLRDFAAQELIARTILTGIQSLRRANETLGPEMHAKVANLENPPKR